MLVKQYKFLIIFLITASSVTAEEVKFKLYPIVNQETDTVYVSSLGKAKPKLNEDYRITIPDAIKLEATKKGYWVNKSDLSSLINNLYPKEKIKILGPQRIKVRCPMLRVDKTLILSNIEELYRKKIIAGDDIAVDSIDTLPKVNLCVRPGKTLVKRFSNGKIRSREAVNITFESEGKVVSSFPLWLSLSHQSKALISIDQYKKGTLSNKIRVTQRQTDVAKLNENIISEIPSGMRLKKNLSPDEVITVGMFEAVPEVEIGSQVKIVSIVNAVRVITTGVALSDGKIGDLVSVKLKNGKSMFKAEVLQKGEVVVRGGI
ncbi:flagellar basal body P-ring formation chaperone FlgA [uncultured Microbulbifer sp.]|uniref:flagellar basal body P-ring formation chaperone FlgA n=1 Tax=uncultured Microbulbifer sp. TaxID=348147 RepID=UPI0026130D3D|nr:flagellar basal body P-ring formation chaperone FlgA [uncultured Microbulbifer sp.]